jgi:serine/threonine-protein kinase
MTRHDDTLHALAAAIADGGVVDWASAESNVTDESQQAVIRDMKVIAAIAELHGSSAAPALPVTGTLPRPHPDAFEDWGTLHLLEKVGQGAYGEVYRAWDTRLNREVALKLLHAELGDSEARAAAVLEEGRHLARVRHPNVAAVYGAERFEGRSGLWMEFLRGRTLARVLEEAGVFSAHETIHVGAELCRAVSAVNGAGLVHCDIKAQNVMQTDDGRVVLMDFGSGWRLFDRTGHRRAGTPLYLAPELLRGGEPTIRSDIYSIGVLLFHLLTRSYPVQGDGIDDLSCAHQRGDRVEVRSVRPRIPRRLARIIQRAIDPEPEHRYETADAMARELRSLQPRSRMASVAPVVSAAAALFLVAWLGLEWRSRYTGSAGPASPVGAGPSRASPVTPAPTGPQVIVVLPFENLSTEENSDVFVEGLTIEILYNLALIEGLQVLARESSFAFWKTTTSLQEIGRQLDADLFLQGSVRLSGTRLRVNPRLVRSDGTVEWTDQLDGEFGDIFKVQDEISRAIVNRLRLTLGRGQRRYDTDPQAYESYLRGRALLGRTGAPDLLRAAAMFQQVLERDSGYAPAHAGLANAYALASLPLNSMLPFEKAEAILRPAAFRAHELDPLLAEAHIALGWVYSREHDWIAAEKAFQQAISLNASLTEAYTGYSNAVLQPLGKLDEALRILEEALRNDPLSLELQREIGAVQLLKGQFAKAIDTLERLRAAKPDFPFVGVHLGRALTFAGRLPEAIAMMEGLDGRHLGPFKAKQASRSPWLALAYVRAGRRADAEKLAAEHRGADPGLAIVHAALGDSARAFDALERLADAQPHQMGRMLIMPELAGLRDDARFAALRARFSLPAR